MRVRPRGVLERMRDKDVIESWLKIYGVLNMTTFRVIEWPDKRDSTKKAIDALCVDGRGNRLAVEHTLIQPFEGEKADRAVFIKALAALENDPRLVVPGFAIDATQTVNCVPSGVQRSNLSALIRSDLEKVLPILPVGQSKIDVTVGNSSIPLTIYKDLVPQGEQPSFSTARIWPGDSGPELVMKALRDKIPKLAVYTDATKLLLFEKDAVAGTVESQFGQLPATAEIEELLRQVDAIWMVNSCYIEPESKIFTNDIWPTLRETVCSLDLETGEFWRATR